jgi:chromosome segregation ATPase
MTDYTPEDDSVKGMHTQHEHQKEYTPAEKLEKLKHELDNAIVENETRDRKIDHLKSNIADLSKAVGEIDKNTKDWEKAAQIITQQKKDEQAYYDNKKKMLEATVPNKPDIIALKEKEDKKVAELEALVNTLTSNIPALEQTLATARNNSAAKKQQYDETVNLAKKDTDLLKDLVSLRALAEKEDEKNNISRMYFLILEMGDDLKEIEVPSVAQFKEKVNAAEIAVLKAVAAEQTAQDELDKTKAALKKAEKDLSDELANGRANTLALIQENVGPPVIM